MCTTFFIVNPISTKFNDIQFIIGFNRDQNIERTALTFDQFQQDKNIWAGRDTQSGGTWLGFNQKTGILIFITNYIKQAKRNGLSRGKITRQFLSSDFLEGYKNNPNQKIFSRIKQLLKDYEKYNQYNLHVYHIFSQTMYYACSQVGMKEPIIVEKNKFHGTANADFFTIVPKTDFGIKKLKYIHQKFDQNQSKQEIMNKVQEILKDRTKFSQENKSALFVQPYYDTYFENNRMTKSQFLGIISKKNEKQHEFHFKEITFNVKSQIQSTVENKVMLKEI